MDHPVPYLLAVTGVLLFLAVPFLGLETGSVDDRVVPEDVSGRQAADDIRANFSSRESAAFGVVVRSGLADDDGRDALATAYSALDGVARVDSVDGFYAEGERIADASAGRRARPGLRQRLGGHVAVGRA